MRAPRWEIETGLKKGSWSQEEDEKLVAYIRKYGIWNWCKMPQYAGLARTGKSCRLRWLNYLTPNVKRGSFTEEEEETVIHLHSILGNKWSVIAGKLDGRTDNEVKNHWHTHLKKRKTKKLVARKEQKEIPTPNHEVENSNDHTKKMDDLFSCVSEEDCSSSSTINNSISGSKQEIDFGTDYNIGSPGTVGDIESFWRQLYPTENLETENIQPDMFLNSIIQDNEPIGSYGLFDDNEYRL